MDISPTRKHLGLDRLIWAFINAKGNAVEAAKLSQYWRDTPEVHQSFLQVSKTAVPPMDTVGTSALVPYQFDKELSGAIRGASVLGPLQPFMRATPFDVDVAVETSGVSSQWVGESEAVPVLQTAYQKKRLAHFKTSTIVVISAELAKLSIPDAQASIRTSLVQGCAAFLDAQFLDLNVTASAQKNPVSITHTGVVIASTGLSGAQILADLQSMLSAWVPAHGELGYWIMKPTTAVSLAGKQNAVGIPLFPGISVNGGSLLGLPVITSTNSPAQICLLDPSDVLLADNGEVELDLAKYASLLMDDNPGASPVTTAVVSLFERNLVGIRIVRWIAWERAHSNSAVTMLVNY